MLFWTLTIGALALGAKAFQAAIRATAGTPRHA